MFMKNYDELINDLLERRDCYVANQKKKRKRIRVTSISLCCIFIVALLGFGIKESGALNIKPYVTNEDTTVDEKKDYNNFAETDNIRQAETVENEENQNNESQTQTDEGSDFAIIAWTINRARGQIDAEKLNFPADKYYSERKSLAEITEYFGKDFSELCEIMPQGFEFAGGYETDFFYGLDGKAAYDTCNFCYKNEDRQINIKVSKIGEPYDCVYILENPTISYFNGVEVTLGGLYNDEESDELELVFAEFSHEGLYYRITAENIEYDGKKNMSGYLASVVSELTK